MSEKTKTRLQLLRQLVHAAFHLLDDSETNAQTEVISIDNEIAANDLKEMSEALDELGIECHEDIDGQFCSRGEDGHPARLYTAPDCEWEQSQSRTGLMFVLASEHDILTIDCNTLRAANEGLRDSYLEQVRVNKALVAALDEALEYFDDCADVVDGDYGEPAPNKAMLVAQSIHAALKAAQP